MKNAAPVTRLHRLPGILSAIFVCLCLTPASLAQAAPISKPESEIKGLRLTVEVTGKKDMPVGGLAQEAFTLLDNGKPKPITSFRVLDANAPAEITVILDAVNASFLTVTYERDALARFLTAHPGQLPHPVRLALLTDKGLEAASAATRDAAQLSQQLSQIDNGLRTIRRSAGFYGAAEELDISFAAMQSILASESALPGRKLIIWISPGWPLLSGPGVDLSMQEQKRLFAGVVELSSTLERTSTTFYAVDPRGTTASLSGRTYYESFTRGISKPSQTDEADLSLQVLSVQSGGMVLNGSNDLSGLLARCMEDANGGYEMTFTPARADRPNEYHKLEVRVSMPGVVARTTQGYYAQP